MPGGFPVTLTQLPSRRCLVVGGGQVAERKVLALLEAGARTCVIAPVLSETLARLEQLGRIEWLARPYSPGDLAQAFLVIAATDDVAVNRAVAREASERGCLINVVDDPDSCNFITPAVVRRGELTISVSTGGRLPALSAYLRARLESEFGPAWEVYVALLAQARAEIRDRYPDPVSRRRAWRLVLAAGLEADIAEMDIDLMRARIREILDVHGAS